MKAINVANPSYTYKVQQYRDVLYFKTDSKCEYYILELCNYPIEDITPCHEYSHYTIGDKLYTGFFSNVYKAFAHDQISMEEFL